jgi:hypothetical protein
MSEVLYGELRRLAHYFLSAERPNHTLQPTCLVHEAYLRLASQDAVDWRNRAHLLAMAASMMWRILINVNIHRRKSLTDAYGESAAKSGTGSTFTTRQTRKLAQST